MTSASISITQLMLAAVFTAAGALAGYKLTPRAAAAVLLQLLVLALLCMWLLQHWWQIHLYPLVLLGAMCAALLIAQALKFAYRHTQAQQTRNYELLLRNLELKQTQLQIVHQDEVERRLLAADLHDQVLNDLKLARRALSDYREHPHPATAVRIEELLVTAMEGIHQVMDNLCPSVLEHFGLPAAVEELLNNACFKSGMKKRFNNKLSDAQLQSLSSTSQALLYRLIQESINNACKHAQGKSLEVSLSQQGSDIVVSVSDDGKGLELSTADNNSRGIRYMKQRAELLGAKISWHRNYNNAGSGTRVEIRLPAAAANNLQPLPT